MSDKELQTISQIFLRWDSQVSELMLLSIFLQPIWQLSLQSLKLIWEDRFLKISSHILKLSLEDKKIFLCVKKMITTLVLLLPRKWLMLVFLRKILLRSKFGNQIIPKNFLYVDGQFLLKDMPFSLIVMMISFQDLLQEIWVIQVQFW